MPTTVTLPELWLPILVAGVVVFFLAFLAHMVIPHHKSDFRKADAQDELMELIRTKIKPGQYMFPFCDDWNDLKDPEKKKWWEAGPHGMLRVWPTTVNMGRNLALSLATYLLIALFIGYLGTQALDAGADFRAVFRFTGTAGVMAYCLGTIPGSIWYRPPGRMLVNELADCVVYGLATGLVFAWMWPALPV